MPVGKGPGRRADRKPPAPQGPKRPAPGRRVGVAPQGPKRPTFGYPLAVTGGYDEHGFPIPKTGLSIPSSPYRTGQPATIPTFQGFSRAEEGIIGTPQEGLIRDIINFGSTYGPVVGPTTATQFAGADLGGGGLGGGGGGLSVPEGPAELPDISTIKWKQGNFNLKDSKAPNWWKSLVPENAADMERPDVAYVAMLNTMIPYLSPEDQKRAAGLIYETVGGAHFGHYEKVDVQAPITRATANLSPGQNLPVIDTQYYQSASRGSGAVDALSQLREQTVGGNREKIGGTGIGYRFLQDLLAQIEQFGGKPGEGQTRSQQLAMQGALDPLFAQLNSPEIGPVGAIAQMLGTPFFSQGSLSPFSRQGNRVFFGQPNPILF